MAEMAEAELRGRIMALETLFTTLLAHMAAHTDNPVFFTAQVMENAETMLQRAAQQAPQEMEQTALFALQSFGNIADQMLAHLTRHATPGGNG